MKPFETFLNRRDFIKRVSVGAAALGSGALTAARAQGANERIHIGLIGTGDRCQALMADIFKLADKHNVQITALCDVWQKNLNSTAAKVSGRFGSEPRKVTRFGEVLRMKDVDAVVIATPDNSHAAILLAALDAGKDVYVEKPMCTDILSATKALDLARANKRVVQVGTQRRSEGKFIGAARELQSGALGKINRVSAAMYVNQARWARPYEDCQPSDVDWDAFLFGQRKKVPFDAKLLRRWQLYRMCSNGIPGLWMTHYADAISLLTGAKFPSSVVALGGKYVWKDDREHADTFHALLDYPEGFLFSWAMGLGNSAGVHFTVHGTEGTLDMDKGIISCDGGRKFEPRKLSPVANQNHMDNWLECLRSRKRPSADIEYGHQHTVATVMAATAFETGRRQHYNPTKRTISAVQQSTIHSL
jgi:predicted dehydrogenase